MAVSIDTSEEPKPDGTGVISRSIIHFEEVENGYLVWLIVKGWQWHLKERRLRSERLPLFEIPFEDLEKTIERFRKYHYDINLSHLPKDEGGAETVKEQGTVKC